MYEGLSKLLKALANPNRLEIVEMLSKGEMSVEKIVKTSDMRISNASQHLQVMKNNNILKSRKEGHYVYYSIAKDEFLSLYQHIITYAVSEIAELERIPNRQREDNQSLNAVSLDGLGRMIENDHILLLMFALP